ncbi:MAG TPA: ubiquinol oxidase subunit II [Candidatus Saccharimonadales bacterium]|nr:ubiquinol oxidase subunit II [Candidatus Saccharimonadales bacterium]
MNKKPKLVLVGVAVAAFIVALAVYLSGHTIDVLQPAGQISYKERQLIILGVLLSVVVVVPTFALTIFIAWKYREGNHRPKKYNPDWDHSWLFESVWWGIPIVIIGVLSVVTWRSAHALDPYKALVSNKTPLTVQVVSLDWKWLFIYPQQNVASVNFAQIPTDTPVNFELTSDTVMNSFWVPQLGGQIYAMPGMNTELHLIADRDGAFNGSSANISGSGFAGMTFTVRSGSTASFNSWVKQAQAANRPLNSATYAQLAAPSKYNPPSYYSTVQKKLYDDIMIAYMEPGGLPAPTAANNSKPVPTTQSSNAAEVKK